MVLVRDMASTSYKGNLLVLSQVVKIISVHLSISATAFKTRICSLARKKVINTSHQALMRQLKGLGAVGAKASNIQLASVSTIARALQRFPPLLEVAAAINLLSTVVKDTAGPVIDPTAMQQQQQQPPAPMPALPHVIMPAAPASTSLAAAGSLFYPYTTSFPDKLLTAELSPGLAIQRYGLLARYKPLPNSMPIKEELKAYEPWSKDKGVLSRPDGVYAISTTTYADHQSSISCFLGYCELYQQVPRHSLSLKLFSNHMLWLNWIAFCKARSTSTQHMISLVSHSIRVVAWLKEKDNEARADPLKVIRCHTCASMVM